MQLMPNKKLNSLQVNWLITNRLLSSGAEAAICRTNNPHTVYKIFRKLSQPIPMCDNKIEKIKKLYQMSLDNATRPIRTLSCNGELIGYEMTYDSNDTRFSPYYLSKEEIIHYLEETKRILEYFASKDIIFGDVADRNILINNQFGNITFCDMDNIRLGQHPIDLIALDLRNYEERRGIDEYVDHYMHSLFTLHTFDLDEYCDDLSFVTDIFEDSIEPIISTLREPEEYQDEYIIDYIKK